MEDRENCDHSESVDRADRPVKKPAVNYTSVKGGMKYNFDYPAGK